MTVNSWDTILTKYKVYGRWPVFISTLGVANGRVLVQLTYFPGSPAYIPASMSSGHRTLYQYPWVVFRPVFPRGWNIDIQHDGNSRPLS